MDSVNAYAKMLKMFILPSTVKSAQAMEKSKEKIKKKQMFCHFRLIAISLVILNGARQFVSRLIFIVIAC